MLLFQDIWQDLNVSATFTRYLNLTQLETGSRPKLSTYTIRHVRVEWNLTRWCYLRIHNEGGQCGWRFLIQMLRKISSHRWTVFQVLLHWAAFTVKLVIDDMLCPLGNPRLPPLSPITISKSVHINLHCKQISLFGLRSASYQHSGIQTTECIPFTLNGLD